jgi:hypothetical protein
MYAVTAICTMDSTKKAKLIEGLEPQVIATTREMPGFVTGFWSWDHNTDVSYGFIVFDTIEHARALETFLRGSGDKFAEVGVRLERAAVGELIGSAAGPVKHGLRGQAIFDRLKA